MPKKKKKGRASRESANVDGHGTPSSSKKNQPSPRVSSTPQSSIQLPVISLRLLKGSSGSLLGKKSLKYSPTILLHEFDAVKLAVMEGDRVFAVSMDDSLPQQVVSVAIARVKITDSTNNRSSALSSPLFSGASTDMRPSHKKNKLTPGNCYLFPVSLADSFIFPGDSNEFSGSTSITNTPKIFESTSPVTPTTLNEAFPKHTTPRSSKSKFSFANGGGGDQLIATPPTKSIPSPSKSNFSFSTGGGGDQLISPTASVNRTTPSTPSSIRSKSVASKIMIQIVPFDSQLGDILVSTFCRPANTLSVLRCSLDTTLDNEKQNQEPKTSSVMISWPTEPQLCRHLILAHTAGEYLSNGTLFSISIQGKTVRCLVHGGSTDKVTVHDDDVDALAADLEMLSLSKNRKIEDIADKSATAAYNLETCLLSSLSEMSNEKAKPILLYHISHATEIDFIDNIRQTDSSQVLPEKTQAITPLVVQHKARACVVGLDETIKQIRAALELPLLHPELFTGTKSKIRPPKGILLHGPSGCGKSALAQQVGQDFESNGAYYVQRIHCAALRSQTSFIGQAEARLVKFFADAEKPRVGKSGCLLILDDIHLICPRREGLDLGADRLASTLLALLDGMKSGEHGSSTIFYPTVILAITTNPGALDAALRRPGRLDVEIEVPLPDEPSIRLKILKFQLALLETETDFSHSEWLLLARLAKGFTGADLKLAAKDALRETLVRSGKRKISFPTMKKAIVSTKPSAIKAVTVEVPSVPWTSIGGMDEVKRQLRDAIELPLTHGQTFKRLGIRPPRGVLLYGPPGCSKTLMARALATEGQMNFLAVKGPELLSKWLGESERALAALFRRARLASPAIIFFDEVDAIASKRGGTSSGGGERLLSQLLTELDGIQHNKDSSDGEGRVVIVCATNRPDLLDGALMRPGRIDRMIYVGVPDERSRKNILEIGLKKSCRENIDIDHLAKDEISGGLSGAELIGACRDAALKAMEDFEEKNNFSTDPMITTEHVLTTLTEMERQITPENLAFYAAFQGNSLTK